MNKIVYNLVTIKKSVRYQKIEKEGYQFVISPDFIGIRIHLPAVTSFLFYLLGLSGEKAGSPALKLAPFGVFYIQPCKGSIQSTFLMVIIFSN